MMPSLTEEKYLHQLSWIVLPQCPRWLIVLAFSVVHCGYNTPRFNATHAMFVDVLELLSHRLLTTAASLTLTSKYQVTLKKAKNGECLPSRGCHISLVKSQSDKTICFDMKSLGDVIVLVNSKPLKQVA